MIRGNDSEVPDLGPDDGSVGFAPDREGFGDPEPTRPDMAIYRDIVERIGQHPALDPSHCEIVVQNGEVRLAGEVSSSDARRLFEDLCLSVPGVSECENRLRVSPATGRD
jgi:osmotically-inducible protein OsmY